MSILSRPATGTSAGQATLHLTPAETEEVLDALPLLPPHLSRRTVPPEHALRGQYLAFRDGEQTRLLALREAVTYIGRAPSSDVRLDDHRVSRSHAILVRHGRHYRLLDNRSLNGTYLNGRRVASTNLNHGDEIALGPVGVEFVEVP